MGVGFGPVWCALVRKRRSVEVVVMKINFSFLAASSSLNFLRSTALLSQEEGTIPCVILADQ